MVTTLLLRQAGEVQLGTRLVSLMCLCECVGNGVKDLVCAPRPKGHPKGAGKTKLLLSEKAGAEDAKVHSLVSKSPSQLKLLTRKTYHLAAQPQHAKTVR